VADDTNNQIKGYASLPSVDVGGSITFYVTVNPAQTYTMDIYRMGYYQGLGGRLMLHVNAQSGLSQPSCPIVDPATNLVACSWNPSYTLTVPTGWTDGIYFVVLTNAAGYQNYIPFVVRDDSRGAALLFQSSTNTYQAYNNWGGYSLYGYNSTGGNRAYKVSYDRPYHDDGSGDYFGWEVYFVQWAEEQGYDLTYWTDVDTEANPNRLLGVKGFLAVGHDEYWTRTMYNAAQNALNSGVSLGFFGGNDVYWQARFESSASGAADRVLVSYKTSDVPNSVDPITASNPALTTDLWRNPQPNRPEQGLIGEMFTSQTGSSWDATVSYVVANASNFIYTGTGFGNGTPIPKIEGYEADRVFPTFPPPSYQPNTYTILSSSPYVNVNGANDTGNSTIYQALSGAWVFSSGSNGWNYALARPGYVNAGIQSATANVLNLFVGNVPTPITATPTTTPPPTPTAGPSAYRDTVQADHPTSYWRLDESGGSIAYDDEASNNGGYISGPTLGQPGAIRGDPDAAVGFDGVTQYVSVPYAASLNPSVFSVEVWAKPTGGAGTYRGVAASRAYPYGWVFYASSNDTWQFWVNNSSGMAIVSGGGVTLNVWTHLVGTFDGSTARIYVNGQLAGTGSVTAYQPQASKVLTIGQGEPGGNFFFPGIIDEPALYGSVLTAAQIQNHYLLGSQSVTPTATPSPGHA
jgi:hypothetical protein